MNSEAHSSAANSSFISKYKWLLLIGVPVVIIGGIYVSRIGKVSTDRTIVMAKQQSIPSPGGSLVEILIKPYDVVKKGQVLFRMNSVRQKTEVQEAETALAEAKGKVESARSAVENASAEERPAQEDELSKAVEAFQKAESTLDSAQKRLAACDIKSPIDGYVGSIYASTSVGMMTGEPMVDLVDPTNIWVLAKFNNTQIEDVKPGQRVKLVTSEGSRIDGIVDNIGRTEDPEGESLGVDYGADVQMVREVEVKVVIPPESRGANTAIVPGMDLTATIDTRS